MFIPKGPVRRFGRMRINPHVRVHSAAYSKQFLVKYEPLEMQQLKMQKLWMTVSKPTVPTMLDFFCIRSMGVYDNQCDWMTDAYIYQ